MATDGDERMALDRAAEFESSSSDSENGGDKTVPAPEAEVEWLATNREKRSTAGNRMKSMLAVEEPDDELELLFAEDGDDAGFSEVDDGDASDVHMDSSSDDEDAQENGDEEAGEKELERQARESKQAARKRKAQEAIPLKFRKKVKIAADATSPAATKPPPRPKKKSERASWLPTSADMPTRASKRETTMMSKEQLHQQMVEREAKRLKQIEAMERKARKREALRKPPMTQAERLAEAAITEKRNAKSLNRWEEAEKQREEERRAKLAALNSRTLKGPVVTFWSGVGEWVDGKLKHVGKIVIAEEKPVKKKRASVAGAEPRQEVPPQDGNGKAKDTEMPDRAPAPTANPPETKTAGEGVGMPDKPLPTAAVDDDKLPAAPPNQPASAPQEAGEPSTTADKPLQAGQSAATGPAELGSEPSATETRLPAPKTPDVPAPEVPAPETKAPETKAPETKASVMKAPVMKAPEMKAPEMKPPDLSPYTSSMFAVPAMPPSQQASATKPPTNSFLAPPPGATQSGLSMPVLGYATPSATSDKASNVLAPPMPAQRQSPLSMPKPDNGSPPVRSPAPAPAAQTQAAAKPTAKLTAKPKGPQANTAKSKAQAPVAAPPPRPPTPPANGKAARNCIILQNFDENAIKEKAVQTHILFGHDMPKLAKPGPAPRCVITHHPARYRDPKTGLPFYNSHAYKEIQRLQRGDYKWSSLLGVWVGGGSLAATGVPARFSDPNAPAPPKETEASKEPLLSGTGKAAEYSPSELSKELGTPNTSRPPLATPSTGKPAFVTPSTNEPAQEVATPNQTHQEPPDSGANKTTETTEAVTVSTTTEPQAPSTGNPTEVAQATTAVQALAPTQGNEPTVSMTEVVQSAVPSTTSQLPAEVMLLQASPGSDVKSNPPLSAPGPDAVPPPGVPLTEASIKNTAAPSGAQAAVAGGSLVDLPTPVVEE